MLCRDRGRALFLASTLNTAPQIVAAGGGVWVFRTERFFSNGKCAQVKRLGKTVAKPEIGEVGVSSTAKNHHNATDPLLSPKLWDPSRSASLASISSGHSCPWQQLLYVQPGQYSFRLLQSSVQVSHLLPVGRRVTKEHAQRTVRG
jgi:hypothetical protein